MKIVVGESGLKTMFANVTLNNFGISRNEKFKFKFELFEITLLSIPGIVPRKLVPVIQAAFHLVNAVHSFI